MAFGFCDVLSTRCTNCWEGLSVLFCSFNTIILLIFITCLIVSFLITTFNKCFNKKSYPDLLEAFRQSIFSCLTEEGNEKKVSSFALYFIIAFGIFFIRPLGYLCGAILTQYSSDQAKSWTNRLAIGISAITEAIYFLIVLFMIYFFGIKAEIIHLKGHPHVTSKERGWFLSSVLKRSVIFTLIYFCTGILRLFTASSYTLFNAKNSSLFEWTLKGIEYAFILTLALNRHSYVKYADKMSKKKAQESSRTYLATSLPQHIDLYTVPNDQIPSLIDEINVDNENQFLQEFQINLTKHCDRSTYLLQEKKEIMGGSQEHYEALPDNTMEKYIIGSICLGFIIFDSICNTLISISVIVASLVDSNTENVNIILQIAIYVLFISYAGETIAQWILCLMIVSDKANFGERLEQTNSKSDRPSGASNNSRVSLSMQKSVGPGSKNSLQSSQSQKTSPKVQPLLGENKDSIVLIKLE